MYIRRLYPLGNPFVSHSSDLFLWHIDHLFSNPII
jgi:hypothetical protein